MEESWGLRIALLVIGIAVIAGVYVLSVWRRRQRSQRYRHDLSWSTSHYADDVDLPAELGRDSVDDEIIAVRVRKIEPLVDLPIIKNDAVTFAAEPPVEPPRDRPRGRRKQPQDQLTFGFGGEPEIAGNNRLGQAAGAAAEPAMLRLYLRPRAGAAFAGPVLVRNANAVGLRHGEHQIFHHFGTGDLRTERALFSLANMFEPGYFDLGRIEAFQTAGLVMFMNLPTGLDGAVAFELFLNTAQRLAEGLQADLFHDPKALLDSGSIDRMRRTAARFANAG